MDSNFNQARTSNSSEQGEQGYRRRAAAPRSEIRGRKGASEQGLRSAGPPRACAEAACRHACGGLGPNTRNRGHDAQRHSRKSAALGTRCPAIGMLVLLCFVLRSERSSPPQDISDRKRWPTPAVPQAHPCATPTPPHPRGTPRPPDPHTPAPPHPQHALVHLAHQFPAHIRKARHGNQMFLRQSTLRLKLPARPHLSCLPQDDAREAALRPALPPPPLALGRPNSVEEAVRLSHGLRHCLLERVPRQT